MTRETALTMIAGYEKFARGVGPLAGMRSRFPEDGSENKAMRWLGFCQGILCDCGLFTLDELKEHSRTGTVPPFIEMPEPPEDEVVNFDTFIPNLAVDELNDALEFAREVGSTRAEIYGALLDNGWLDEVLAEHEWRHNGQI